MRKLLFLGAIGALILGVLILPPLSDASKNDKSRKRITTRVPNPDTWISTGFGEASLGRPISLRAVGFAESKPVAEIAKSQKLNKRSKRRAQPIDREELMEQQREKAARASGESVLDIEELLWEGDEEHEINDYNREIIRTIDERVPGTPEAALASVPGKRGTKLISPKVMPSPNVSFNGIGNPEGCGGCLPPDTNGEIGPTQYVQTVNTAWRVFSRTGTPLTPTMTLGSLFAALPGACANTNDGDPIVMYDQLADRWFISQFCWSVAVPNHQIIAVSKTGDATGAYYLYDFVMPNIKFNDYPHFGVWPDGYYMTDNQFNQAGTAFQGAGVFAFDRTKMLVGDPTASFVYFDKAEGCTGNGATCQFGGMLPTDMDGFTLPPAGAPNPIIQFDANEFGAANDALRIFDFHVDFATPANSTLIERTGSPLLVAPFDPREVPAGSRNNVPQPGGTALDVISDRLMWRIAYRNYTAATEPGGVPHESLALSHSVNAATNPAFRAGVRYYELRKTTPAAAWTVREQATMAGAPGDTEHRFMGSTALNQAGSQAVGYSVSSTTVFPSVRYAGRLSTDPAGSLAQGEATMVAGGGFQTSTSGRWGDYSDMTVDPLDDCTFWYTQEYYSATSGANWATRIGSFTFGSCPAIPKGVLNGTVTSAATGNPINNATVIASNGFSRTSNASGVYNIDPMAPGTVTLIVSAPGYATATVPGVVITLGNTTTQNVQLTPLNNIVAGASSVMADSCNSNLILDPNEVVTVNLSLANIGGDGASTSNLVGTLQATGGVTNPSGPQNYGAVISGQPAVTKSFTFTVNATCGGTVTATLALQDGATDFGTRTFTFQVGALTGAFPTTGAISVGIPDNNPPGVDIPITVPDNVTINDVNVRVRLNHTFDQDLDISIIHPDNTSVALSTARGSNGDNFGTGANDCSGTPTIFDDAAATAIGDGIAPFAGSFRPETPLSVLNGKTANGTWKLHIVDTANLDVGTVGCVSLEINKIVVCCTAPAPPVASTTLAINEFRLRGAAGAQDEYIEIVNVSGGQFTVTSSDGSAGWSVGALNSAGTVASIVATIPNGTVIPARGHFLIANNTAVTGYSLSSYGGAGNATPDATYTSDLADNTGIALFNTANVANLSANTRIDTVNFTTQNGSLSSLFTEGNRLAPITGDGQYAFVRKLLTGLSQDTGDNAADFSFVSITAGIFGSSSIRGGPGPENLASPIQRNAAIKASLIDPTQASTAPPNRIRDTTPGVGATAQGTLDLRRKFTNNTGGLVTRLRFRVVDITTTNTPNPGGTQADMRVLSSSNTTANGGTITIIGTTLESPSDATVGGGLNSTLVVTLPGGALAPGASINVRYLLGVASGGTFRFFINVEALP